MSQQLEDGMAMAVKAEDDKDGKGGAQPSPMGMAPPPQAYGYGFPAFPPQPMMMGGPPMMMMAPPAPYAYPPGMPGMMPVAPPAQKSPRGQCCNVHPPGYPRAFDVSFPERKLPVCSRCKKNYRSRELCRQRDGHRALPWQTTYVVVTLTDEVLEKKPDGTLCFADIPVVAELQDTPEMCRGPADGSMRTEPICKVCKEKNYTTDHCRNTLKHTTPPYQSAYVKLVPKTDGIDDKPRPPKRKKKRQEEHCDGRPAIPESAEGTGETESDNLQEIHPSKTFFMLMSAKKIVVKWCEAIRYPEGAEKPAAAPNGAPPPGFPSYMNNPQMGQVTQMQMWDAFRAGAMWAQSQAQGQGGGMPPGMPPGYGAPAPGYAPPPGDGSKPETHNV